MTRSTRYGVLVKGANGRKWFRADTASCGAPDIAEQWVDDCAKLHGQHGLTFKMGASPELEAAPIAPSNYRPWDTTPDVADEDVDLDALSDDEL